MENKQEINQPHEHTPDELWLRIAEELDADDISALNSTCRFFSFQEKSDTFKKQWMTIKQNKHLLLCAQGIDHTLIYINKKLFVTGNNIHGQLGLKHVKPESRFVECKLKLNVDERIILLAAGCYTSFFLTNHNRLFACGYHAHGSLGLGDTLEFPTSNTYDTATFTQCALPLEPGESIIQLAAGHHHTLLLTNHNRLLVCGYNTDGQLGLGHNNTIKCFVECSLNLNPEEKPLKIAAGGHHSLIATNQNRLLVCGNNRFCQLGFGDYANRNSFTPLNLKLIADIILEIGAGDYYSYVLTPQNKLLFLGFDFDDEEEEEKELEIRVVDFNSALMKEEHLVSMSVNHTSTVAYLISNQNRLFVYGNESLPPNNSNPFRISELALHPDETIKLALGGTRCTLVLTNQKRVYVCGSNLDGQLGLGDTKSQPNFVALTHNREDNTLNLQVETEKEENTRLTGSLML